MPTQPTLLVEIALANTSTSVFNTLATWIDVTADVLSLTTQRGRSQDGDQFEAGTARIVLDNALGNYTPGNATGDYALTDGPANAPYLSPMRPIRIHATWNTIKYAVWYGYIERWVPSWPGGAEGTMTIDCADGFKILAQEIATFTEVAQFVGTRIYNIVTTGIVNIWPTSFLDIELAQRHVAAITFSGESPLSHMQAIAQADNGSLFMAPDGKLTYHAQLWRTTYFRSTMVQATFGYDPLPAIGWLLGDAALSVLGSTTIPRAAGFTTSPEVPYLTVNPSLDDARIINTATITAASAGATPQTATNLASRAQFGHRAYVATVPLDGDVYALDYATWLIATRAFPTMRITSLTASGHQTDDLWPIILDLRIDDRVRVLLRPMRNATMVGEYYIEAVGLDITKQGDIIDWVLTLALSPAPLL